MTDGTKFQGLSIILSFQNTVSKLLLLLCLLLVSSRAWAATYYAQVTTSVTPGGFGNAYISTTSSVGTTTNTSQTLSSSDKNHTVTFYVKAVPAPGYTFVRWEFVDASGNTSIASATSTETSITVQTHDWNNNTRTNTIRAVFKVAEGYEDAGYVITYKDTRYLSNNSGSISDVNTFNPNTCLWTGTSGSTFTNNGYYLQQYQTNNGFSLRNSANGDWTNLIINGNKLCRYESGIYSTRYLRYNSGWTAEKTDNPTNNDQYNIIYPVITKEYSAKSTDPAISGDTEINALGENSSFSITTPAARQEAYTDYIFYNGTSHFIDSNGNLVTETPKEAFTNTWSLEDGSGNTISSEYASIDNNGVITYKKSFDADTEVTVKLTATGNKGTSLTAPQLVTFKKMPEFYLAITTETDGNGSITTEPSTLPTVAYGATASSTEGKASVTFTATPKTGYAFVKWTDASGEVLGTDATLTKEFTSNKTDSSDPATFTVKANFQALPKFYYNVVANVATQYADGSEDEGKNVAGGSVRGAGPGVAYGETLTSESATASVKLTATASKGYAFKGWYTTETITETSIAVSTDPEYTLSISTNKTSDTDPATQTLYAHFEEFPIFYAKVNIVCKEWKYNTGGTSGSFVSESQGCMVKTSPVIKEGLVALHATSMSQESAETTIELTALPSEEFGFRGWGKQGAGVIEATAIDDLQNSYSSTRRNDNYKVTATAKSREAAQSQTATAIYAYFKELPLLYFQGNVTVLPCDGNNLPQDKATTSPAGVITGHATSFTVLKGTTSVLYTAADIPNYKFGGWYKKNADDTYTQVSTYNPYSAQIESTSTDPNKPTATTLYAKYLTSMTEISIEAADITLDTESDGWLDIKVKPDDAWESYIITAEDPTLLFVDNFGHVLTNTKTGKSKIYIQGVKVNGETPENLKITVNAKVKVRCKNPEITFEPNASDNGESAVVTLATQEIMKAGSSTEKVMPDIFYSTDNTNFTKYDPGQKPTIRISETLYTYAMVTKADGTTPDTDNYSESEHVSEPYSKPQVATPTINITSDGVTFSCETAGATYYYMVNDAKGGTDPTTETGGYTGTWTNGSTVISTIPNEKWIKVIAVKSGYDDSEVAEKQYIYASGIHDKTVYLNDYEDHTWTYYAGVDPSVDGGHYNSTYIAQGTGTKLDVRMYSPNPRNVKITYQGNGGEVSIDEHENEFVYYETIEKVNNAYKYQVISNPFSKRPTGKGFGGWKLKSITGTGASIGYAVNATLPLDAELTLTLPDAGVNGTSAEIVFEATWVDATIVKDKTSGLSSSGTYETNLIVLTKNYSNNIAIDNPCTIMMVEPDGSKDYRGSTLTGAITPVAGAANKTKIEFAKWNPNGNINPQGRNFTIGRGVTTSGTSRTLYGTSTNTTVNQILKVESGTYAGFTNYGTGLSSGYITKQWVTLGCDYDRAKNDNEKLNITGAMYVSNGSNVNASSGQEVCRVYSKSGKFTSSATSAGTGAAGSGCYYFGFSNNEGDEGYKYLEIQGGEWCNIAGGMGTSNNKNDPCTIVRMKGGLVRGCIYGAAQYAGAAGTRLLVFTGGTIKGWIAGGANGTQSDGGLLTGASYVYVGGNTQVNSNGSTTLINRGVAGNVFGAGCGWTATSDAGKVSEGTNVVVADNAYVERGVYGGGSFGYCATDKTSYIYVTGGHVEGKAGGVNTGNNSASYTTDVKGGVYGGASKNKGGTVNLYMTDGLVEGGVFGGSNASGTLSGAVTMQINGGQLGTEKAPASIHGGGYGTSTQVSGNVDITLGNTNVNPEENPGVKVYGNIYGGSALGKVNGSNGATSAINGNHTNVTVNSGSVFREKYPETAGVYKYGYVFGGGMGDGSDNNGIVDGQINVVINSTDPAPTGSLNKYALYGVFGGGDAAPYNGTPNLTVNNCSNSIEYVYGGGNKASVAGSNVKIHGGNIIGNVFGGGNAADVKGNVHINIEGGHILNVFGGNNASGTVSGNIVLNVNQRGYTSSTCPINIGYLYGGGNRANSNVAQMNIYYANDIDYVFGGAKAANMTGDINLNIVAGKIGTVFGGNDSGGVIDGKINVKVNWDESANKTITFDDGTTFPAVTFLRENNSLENVYGGGNVADYGTAAKPGEIKVKVLNADMKGNVFGGGKEAKVTGTTEVTIGDWNPEHLVYIMKDVYGGGDQAGVTAGTKVTINDCATIIEGDVYGGGNAAPVGTAEATANTNVTVWGGTINRVFGGGHGYPEYTPPVGADIYGSTNVGIFGGTIQEAFGGSNSVGNITGKANITLDQRMCEDPDEDGYRQQDACSVSLQEVYGAGNLAKMDGEPNLNILCVDELGEIYGGARAADIDRDIVLNISSGKYRKVFGGNNISGKINGTITVNVDETGCHPVVIGELYGGGNQAQYEAPEGKESPVVNVISCTSIGTVFGGGYGEGALVIGSPYVHIDMVEGDWSNRINPNTTDHPWDNKLGTIGTVFGGGNSANVEGNTSVNIGTKKDIKRTNGEELPVQGVNITGNVYGGGNQADVTGKTHVQVGAEPATTTP